MNNSIIIRVPLPAHQICYFESKMGENCQKISHKGILGNYLLGLIEHQQKKAVKAPETNFIELEVPARDRHGQGYDGRNQFVGINAYRLKRLEEMIEMLMRQELFAKLDLLVERGEAQRKGGKMTAEIEKFIAKYSAGTELMSLEALRKDYWRHRSRGQGVESKFIK